MRTNLVRCKLIAILIISLLGLPNLAMMRSVEAESAIDEPTRVFQPNYASLKWGYNAETCKTIYQLTSADGPILIYVHGICDDSIQSASSVREVANLGNLKSFVSFEYRTTPYSSSKLGQFWEQISGILFRRLNIPYFSQNDPWDDKPASSYAKELLTTIVVSYMKTGQYPVVVTHSRGGMILVKAAVLWEGLCLIADQQDQDSSSLSEAEWTILKNARTGLYSEFKLIWGSLSKEDKNEVLNLKKIMTKVNIKAVTLEPDASPVYIGWAALKNLAKAGLLNIYSSEDTVIPLSNLFRGLKTFLSHGIIPGFENVNIPLKILFGHVGFFSQPIVQTALGDFIRQDKLSEETKTAIELQQKNAGISDNSNPSDSPSPLYPGLIDSPSPSLLHPGLIDSPSPSPLNPGPSDSPPPSGPGGVPLPSTIEPSNSPSPSPPEQGGLPLLNPTSGLGGVNFTSISLNCISVNTNSFEYVITAQETSDSIQNATLENNIELSFTSLFIGLVLPESKFWVNLNPWEPNRIIEEELGRTDVGRIMLEADLAMKRSFCKYENPGNGDIGIEFWNLLEQKNTELMNGIMQRHPSEIKDVNEVQFSPVTRHWIVPDKVEAYEDSDQIYVVNATLKINSEAVSDQSTFSLENPRTLSESTKADLNEAAKEYGRYVKELQESMILPLVVQEVNHGQSFSDLRRIYVSLALAQWYRNNKNSQGLFSDVLNLGDFDGLESHSDWSAINVYNEYKRSFEEGDYHYWKNSTYQQGDLTIIESKLYVGGGVDFSGITTTSLGSVPTDLKASLSEAIFSNYAKDSSNYYFGDTLTVKGDLTITPQSDNSQDTQTDQGSSENGTMILIAAVTIVTASALLATRYFAKRSRRDDED